MNESLIGKKVQVVTNNRFNGMTGTIIELCYEDNVVVIKYDNTQSKGMFPLSDLKAI